MTRRLARSIVLGALIVTASILAAPVHAQTATQASLYKRLGSYDGIAAVTDDFLGRLLGDARFAKFFAGVSTDSKSKIRQHIVDLLCNETGGPCLYMGRTMKQSHAGLGITEEDWKASVRHLIASLDKLKVAETDKNQLLTIAMILKEDIVEKK